MNCNLVQRRLLSIEDPQRVPADVRGHLAYCETCRDWHSRLILLESNAAYLPVPRSRGQARLIRKLVQSSPAEPVLEPVAHHGVTLPDFPTPTVPFWRTPQRSYRIAAAVAAGLLIATGWWFLQSRPGPAVENAQDHPRSAADPLLASLVQRDVRLATASLVRERIEILADMAQEIQDASRGLALAETLHELDGLATLYDQLVREGILKQALALPAGDRHPILNPIAERFARTARSFELLVQKSPAECGKPLHTIAAAAREGNRQLFGLIAEGRS